MNKILVEVSVGELLDKISILEIKQEKIKDSEKLKFINEEHSILKNQLNNKISLATIYNTVHAFEKKGYLKQIPINSSEAYFDTNVTDHHHFYDLKEEKLIDLENSDVGPINILKKINGKKIKSVEVLVKLED